MGFFVFCSLAFGIGWVFSRLPGRARLVYLCSDTYACGAQSVYCGATNADAEEAARADGWTGESWRSRLCPDCSRGEG